MWKEDIKSFGQAHRRRRGATAPRQPAGKAEVSRRYPRVFPRRRRGSGLLSSTEPTSDGKARGSKRDNAIKKSPSQCEKRIQRLTAGGAGRHAPQNSSRQGEVSRRYPRVFPRRRRGSGLMSPTEPTSDGKARGSKRDFTGYYMISPIFLKNAMRRLASSSASAKMLSASAGAFFRS